jgi:periplasmic divalent cation tolerance protein
MIVPATHIRLVMTTVGSREEAERIAAVLVEAHLAACVNVVPGVNSVYRWQGKVERAEEVLLLIKTTVESLEGVEATLRRLHSYELPEFLVLQPEAGSKAYLDWLLHVVSASP